MNEERTSLYDLARDNREQEVYGELTWEGSFPEYLDRVEREPRHARNAWQRMLDMI